MAPKKSIASSSKPKWAHVVGTSPDPNIPPFPKHLSHMAREWVANRASLKIIVEISINEWVIDNFDIQNLFKGLGWVLLIRLSGHYYPNLVPEFYANMTHKTNKECQTIVLTIKGLRIILDRERLVTVLGIPDNENQIIVDSNRKTIIEDLDWNFDTESFRDSATGIRPLQNHTREQFPKSSSSCSCLFLWAHAYSEGCDFSEDEENKVWIPPSEEDRLRDHSAGGFQPIKKTTQTGIGASSSQLVEDDDEVNESYNP
ncbi:hypothetical protein M9H77_30508 [Catharanthus roseus]|uniref:Uncharacterized protein n=1 Tax=Catharanthus roseus TaxID=4058 RepID=A0ACB9ZXU3_CATRO|nr:hypothetical protein M9H77_30508 [Catharanthus roseus]